MQISSILYRLLCKFDDKTLVLNEEYHQDVHCPCQGCAISRGKSIQSLKH